MRWAVRSGGRAGLSRRAGAAREGKEAAGRFIAIAMAIARFASQTLISLTPLGLLYARRRHSPALARQPVVPSLSPAGPGPARACLRPALAPLETPPPPHQKPGASLRLRLDHRAPRRTEPLPHPRWPVLQAPPRKKALQLLAASHVAPNHRQTPGPDVTRFRRCCSCTLWLWSCREPSRVGVVLGALRRE